VGEHKQFSSLGQAQAAAAHQQPQPPLRHAPVSNRHAPVSNLFTPFAQQQYYHQQQQLVRSLVS
jgi:hypothetical protein